MFYDKKSKYKALFKDFFAQNNFHIITPMHNRRRESSSRLKKQEELTSFLNSLLSKSSAIIHTKL
jgi:hypothetical protein